MPVTVSFKPEMPYHAVNSGSAAHFGDAFAHLRTYLPRPARIFDRRYFIRWPLAEHLFHYSPILLR